MKNFENFTVEEAISAKFFVDAKLKNFLRMRFSFFEINYFEISFEQKRFLFFVFFQQISRSEISCDILDFPNFLELNQG